MHYTTGTLTNLKRSKFPLRYLRKDARTAIYRAVYGPQETWNGPRDGASCLYSSAIAIYNHHKANAMLPLYKAQAVEERIELLKRQPREG